MQNQVMETDRAAATIKARMRDLGLGTRDLKPLGGPSDDTVRRFLRGDIPEGVQSGTLMKFDVALGWRRGSLREVLFSGGEPTSVNDYDTTRVANGALIGPDANRDWCAVPRWMIQDVAALVVELSVLTRDQVGQVAETVSRANTLTADMLAVMMAGSRSPQELARVTEQLERGV